MLVALESSFNALRPTLPSPVPCLCRRSEIKQRPADALPLNEGDEQNLRAKAHARRLKVLAAAQNNFLPHAEAVMACAMRMLDFGSGDTDESIAVG